MCKSLKKNRRYFFRISRILVISGWLKFFNNQIKNPVVHPIIARFLKLPDTWEETLAVYFAFFVDSFETGLPEPEWVPVNYQEFFLSFLGQATSWLEWSCWIFRDSHHHWFLFLRREKCWSNWKFCLQSSLTYLTFSEVRRNRLSFMHLFINCIACKVWDGHSNKPITLYFRGSWMFMLDKSVKKVSGLPMPLCT